MNSYLKPAHRSSALLAEFVAAFSGGAVSSVQAADEVNINSYREPGLIAPLLSAFDESTILLRLLTDIRGLA